MKMKYKIKLKLFFQILNFYFLRNEHQRNKNKKSSKYVKKEKPDYRKWIETHRNEILTLDPKIRTDYVFKHLNEDLKLNKSQKEIYQLLYRSNLINHKPITEDPKISASTTITQLTNDILNVCQGTLFEISQPLLQRYIKVLTDLNKNLNELHEIKETLKRQ